jgi:hypothetical protein
MRNPVAKVARFHNLSEADLVDFALSRDSKYGIVVEYGEATVSNFHVDRLLNDFQRQQAEDAAIMNHTLATPSFEVGCEFDGDAA